VQNGKDVLERIIQRAAEYRQHWTAQARRLARGERSRNAGQGFKAAKKKKASARK